MEHLPPKSDRDLLLVRLAELIARRGPDCFLSRAILQPTPACFPDQWEPTQAGVEGLAQRILGYAGLGELHAHVELYTNPAEVHQLDGHGLPSSWGHTGAAAWFAKIEGKTCYFGAESHQLEDPVSLLGVMCHEVAHAYREHHRLVVSDHDTEERLTDLTTVYLGFGVLTTNSSYQYRASSTGTGTQWSHAQAGYLSPQAMSYLLAAQIVARRAEGRERRSILRHLEPNQRAFVRAACAAHEHAGLALPLLLGLRGDAWLRPRASWWRRLLRR